MLRGSLSEEKKKKNTWQIKMQVVEGAAEGFRSRRQEVLKMKRKMAGGGIALGRALRKGRVRVRN